MAVLPTFLLVGTLVKVIFGLFSLFTDYCFHWLNFISFLDLPTFDEMVAFFKAKDMNGFYWEGTMWFIFCNGYSWNVGLHAAAAIAPRHKLVTAKIMFWTAFIVSAVVYILLAVFQTGQTFSYWYRNFLNDSTTLFGMFFAVQQMKKEQGKT